jgi:phytoene dehydrogenase-like protein
LRYDAIVIGAGHNGLTAAAYLARGGLRVLVLERRDIVGGCAVTEPVDAALAPDCRVSTASYIASMLRPEVIADLKLDRQGLRMIPCEPGVQAIVGEGEVIAWWNDRTRMAREIAQFAPADAERFFATERELVRLASFLEPFFMRAPPDLDSRGWRRLREMWPIWRSLRRASGGELGALTGFLTGALAPLLERVFESERLHRLVLANSLYGKHGGPYQAGTSMGLLFHLLSGGEARRPGFQGHVIGGMGAITAAMRATCDELGVTVRVDAPVKRVNVTARRARGVTLASGEVCDADIVISNADPKRTFLELVETGDLDAGFRNEIRGIRMAGPCGKVNFVLAEEPQVRGMPADRSPVERSLFTIVPTLQGAEDCYAAAQRGDIAEDLWVDCVLASNADPTLAPAGRHMLTCFVQYLPWQPRAGSWDTLREALGEQVTRTIAHHAPNVARNIVARQVLTPLDLERRFAITEGNIFHGDLSLDQLFLRRPVAQWSRYRTPIAGLYLCGAGTHPGGGVTGAPGHNAARAILEDRAR